MSCVFSDKGDCPFEVGVAHVQSHTFMRHEHMCFKEAAWNVAATSSAFLALVGLYFVHIPCEGLCDVFAIWAAEIAVIAERVCAVFIWALTARCSTLVAVAAHRLGCGYVGDGFIWHGQISVEAGKLVQVSGPYGTQTDMYFPIGGITRTGYWQFEGCFWT